MSILITRGSFLTLYSTGYVAVYQSGTTTLRGYINPAAATPSIMSSPPSVAYTYIPPVHAGAPVPILSAGGNGQRLAVGSSSGVPSLLNAANAKSVHPLISLNSSDVCFSSVRFLSTTADSETPSITLRRHCLICMLIYSSCRRHSPEGVYLLSQVS